MSKALWLPTKHEQGVLASELHVALFFETNRKNVFLCYWQKIPDTDIYIIQVCKVLT